MKNWIIFNNFFIEFVLTSYFQFLELWINETNKIYFAIMPDSKDPDDYIKENGKEGFLNLINQKQIIQSFIWNYQLGKINQNNPYEISKFEKDIKKLLSPKISERLKKNEFYKNWLLDMSNICKLFCKFKDEKSISFWLGTQRGCKRYHVDMVPYRLLVTYAGQGTELLHNEGADQLKDQLNLRTQ